MNDLAYADIERAESLLRPLLPDRFSANYIPDFPRRDGSPTRWFQVVFAVGPGDMTVLRAQVHDLFPRMLTVLAQVNSATSADLVSLRARRHCPDSKIYNPDRPFMFIETEWSREGFGQMCQGRDFSQWHAHCATYRNCFDAEDVLTRQYWGGRTSGKK